MRIENSIRRFGRTGFDAEASFAEKFAPEAIRATYKENRLPEKHRTIEAFRNDREQLRSIEWGNLVAADVIEHIPVNGSISTRLLRERVETNNLSNLARVGTYLAGENELDEEEPIERSIVSLQREEEPYDKWEWEFTPYGRGFRSYLELPDVILQLPSEDIFSREAIQTASDELSKYD